MTMQRLPLNTLVALAIVGCVTATGNAFAQSVSGLALDAMTASPEAEALLQGSDATGAAATHAPTAVPSPRRGSTSPAPFGANLFRGGFSEDREDGLNPGYIIQPGDRVTVRVWGAIEYSETLPVDARGNIFVPKVGPITVGGTRNADLNSQVTASVRSVFTDNVRVYTSLEGAQPVGVFVTGYVPRPGRYTGVPSSSALHFIDRAGGIDTLRGSYRDVTVLRDGERLAAFDLYEFLLEGKLPVLQFKDGDTIVVGVRGGTVTVTGDVAETAVFELAGDSLAGRELARSALVPPDVSHVGVSGIRDSAPFSLYIALADFADFDLSNGDSVNFRSDVHDREIVVEVEGSHLGPSRFAIPRDARLQTVLDYIQVDPELADVDAVSLRRASIAARQKSSLDDSLRRLEARYLTASSRTDAEARIRAQEAELISNFVARARDVEPDGRLVVSSGGKAANILLQAGDIISIPRKSDSVLLSGEILVSQAMLFVPGRSARDYIGRAGGFTDRAEDDRIVLVHSNGEVTAARNPVVRAGDEIIVLPSVPVKNLQLASTLVDIIYKIAVAAAVAINL